MKLSKLEKRLVVLGYTIDKPNGGSHWIVRGEGLERPYPLSCHNGKRTEIKELYLKKLAKHLGLTRQDLG